MTRKITRPDDWDVAEFYPRMTAPPGYEDWIQLDRDVCRERSVNEIYPAWQRVGYYAYAKVKRGGTEYRPHKGELARFLSASATNTKRAVEIAVSEGWLGEDSTRECLRLPFGTRYKPYKWNPEPRSEEELRAEIMRAVSL